MTSQQDLHQFLALNPDFGPQRRDPESSIRDHEMLRSQGGHVLFALEDENHGHPAELQWRITRRAQAARDAGQIREAHLEERFAHLNPDFGVLPSRTDPDQHHFAQGRERALALGTRVHLAEARENPGSPELAAWEVRQRALRAGHPARDDGVVQRAVVERATQTSRQGAER